MINSMVFFSRNLSPETKFSYTFYLRLTGSLKLFLSYPLIFCLQYLGLFWFKIWVLLWKLQLYVGTVICLPFIVLEVLHNGSWVLISASFLHVILSLLIQFLHLQNGGDSCLQHLNTLVPFFSSFYYMLEFFSVQF